MVKKTNAFEPGKSKTEKDIFGSNGYLCGVDDCRWALLGGSSLGGCFSG
ncbi:MAG: hypothetical protein QF771_06980 [Candidatus Marinimicrobia bacterium]|nr:hypothetical protein [Candidatus Neomarinimicrobiota bacterium]